MQHTVAVLKAAAKGWREREKCPRESKRKEEGNISEEEALKEITKRREVRESEKHSGLEIVPIGGRREGGRAVRLQLAILT